MTSSFASCVRAGARTCTQMKEYMVSRAKPVAVLDSSRLLFVQYVDMKNALKIAMCSRVFLLIFSRLRRARRARYARGGNLTTLAVTIIGPSVRT